MTDRFSSDSATAMVDKIANIVSDYYDEDAAGRWLKCAQHIADSLTDAAATAPPPSGSASAIADEIDKALTEYLATINEQTYSTRRIRAVRSLKAALWDNKAGIIAHLRGAAQASPKDSRNHLDTYRTGMDAAFNEAADYLQEQKLYAYAEHIRKRARGASSSGGSSHTLALSSPDRGNK